MSGDLRETAPRAADSGHRALWRAIRSLERQVGILIQRATSAAFPSAEPGKGGSPAQQASPPLVPAVEGAGAVCGDVAEPVPVPTTGSTPQDQAGCELRGAKRSRDGAEAWSSGPPPGREQGLDDVNGRP